MSICERRDDARARVLVEDLIRFIALFMQLKDKVAFRSVSAVIRKALERGTYFGISLGSTEDLENLQFLLEHVPHSNLSVRFQSNSLKCFVNDDIAPSGTLDVSTLGNIRSLDLNICFGKVDVSKLEAECPRCMSAEI